MRIHGSIQQLLFAFYIRNAFSPLALSLGFENIYTQSLSSASAEFTPEFNGFFE